MKRAKRNAGFTLLEIIVVIIIIAILASLALPRFFKTVEYSRSVEALATLSTLRQSMIRCYLVRGQDYQNCNAFTLLDVDDPNTGGAPPRLFSYDFGPLTQATFVITAIRETGAAAGDVGDNISIDQDGTRVGAGRYEGL